MVYLAGANTRPYATTMIDTREYTGSRTLDPTTAQKASKHNLYRSKWGD
jgi:hypothetical protein